MPMSHQKSPMKFDSQMTTRVGNGSSAPRPSKRAAKTGMTFQRMTATTMQAMQMTATG